MDKDHISDYVIQQRARMLSVLSIVIAIIQWRWRRRRLRSSRLPIKYGLLVSRDLVRQTSLDELYNGTDKNYIRQLRMRKAVF